MLSFLLNPSCHMGLAVCPLAPPSLSPSRAALKPYYFYEGQMRANCFPCRTPCIPCGGPQETWGSGGGVQKQPSPRAPGCLPGDMMTGCCTCCLETKPNACQATRGLGEGCLPYSAQDRLSQAILPSLEQGATSQGSIPGSGCCLWACGQEAHLGESLCQAPRTVRLEGSLAAMHC